MRLKQQKFIERNMKTIWTTKQLKIERRKKTIALYDPLIVAKGLSIVCWTHASHFIAFRWPNGCCKRMRNVLYAQFQENHSI